MAFRRNRVALRSKARARLLHLAGLSHRDAAHVCRAVDASHVSVGRWVERLEGVRLEAKPRRRRAVALDESKPEDAGQQFYAWAAMTSRRGSSSPSGHPRRGAPSTPTSSGGSSRPASAGPQSSSTGALAPRGAARPGAEAEARDLRGEEPPERRFRTLKDGTGRFYRNLQTGRGLREVGLFLALSALWYNRLRTHQTLGDPPCLKG